MKDTAFSIRIWAQPLITNWCWGSWSDTRLPRLPAGNNHQDAERGDEQRLSHKSP